MNRPHPALEAMFLACLVTITASVFLTAYRYLETAPAAPYTVTYPDRFVGCEVANEWAQSKPDAPTILVLACEAKETE